MKRTGRFGKGKKKEGRVRAEWRFAPGFSGSIRQGLNGEGKGTEGGEGGRGAVVD